MFQRPTRSTRTDTLCPYTTLFRSQIRRGLVYLSLGVQEILRAQTQPITPRRHHCDGRIQPWQVTSILYRYKAEVRFWGTAIQRVDVCGITTGRTQIVPSAESAIEIGRASCRERVCQNV